MASSREFLQYVLEQLSGADEVTYKPMMGEFILYVDGKIFGGIYDDRFFVKPVDAAKRLMPEAPTALPYEGAKPMLVVENVDDKNFLKKLVTALAKEIPEPKRKK